MRALADIARPWTLARIREVALEDAAERIRAAPPTAAAEVEMFVEIGVLDAMSALR
ncbi:hypothetical protein [Sphingomonas sp. ABOLG]|uniref:hypothetical protein n=1 Tax=Sphingomonas sp. ABOLG TaxID=1985880 RepID=UPI0013DDF6B1|nr:hypothetical protein [Sphingomonas sp. ABOLG]